MAKGFDCATKLSSAKAKALKDSGFDYAARYLGTNWKAFDATEAKAIQGAGLKLISIFETMPTKASYFSKAKGINDAKTAYKYAKDVGQPVGSAIYFTVDYGAKAADMERIKEYVDGLNQAIVDYKVGLYGSYDVIQAVKSKVDYLWQTYAWSGGKVAGGLHMHQYQNGVTVDGVSLDRDDIKKDPGAWKTSAKTSSANKTQAKSQTAATYKIRPGDTLSAIALAYGTTVAKLKSLNGISDEDFIVAGKTIKIVGSAPNTKTITVASGDTVSELALQYGSTIAQIKKWNKLDSKYTIYAGQKLRVK